MRMVVCVKQVYDPKTVKLSRSREEIDLRDAVKVLNPPDRYALEAALRLREAVGGEVIALTVGDADAEDVAREAVAIGADKTVLVTGSSASNLQPLTSNGVTRLMVAAIGQLGGVDLVLTGQIGLTDGTGSLAARLAAALDWPVVLDVIALAPESAGLTATVVVDDGTVTVDLATPAVVSIVPGPQRPRYPFPARIANAWNDGMVEFRMADDLGVSAEALSPDIQAGTLILGPERVHGQVLGGTVAEAAAAVAGLLRAKRVI